MPTLRFFLYRKADGVILRFAEDRPYDDFIAKAVVTTATGTLAGINWGNVDWYYNATGVEVTEFPNPEALIYNPANGEVRQISDDALFFTLPYRDVITVNDVTDLQAVKDGATDALVSLITMLVDEGIFNLDSAPQKLNEWYTLAVAQEDNL